MLLDAIVWDVNPIMLPIGNGGLHWYGLCWAVGIYLCYIVQVKLYKHEHCPDGWTDQLFFWIVAGTIIGARLGHCWFYEWHDVTLPNMAAYCKIMDISTEPVQIFGWTINYRNPYIEHPLMLLKVWEGGLASHGGAIGIILAAWGLNKVHFSKYPQYKTSTLWILDRICIGACITGCLIRFGNLLNSEIYGGPTDMPWGFIFLRAGETVPCHPTQIYEMLYCLVALGVTWVMYWRYKAYRREGLLLGIFFEIIFGVRFGLEFIKNDQEVFEANHLLNMGQWLSIPFILVGLILIVRAYKRPLLPIVSEVPSETNTKRKERK